MLGLGNGLGFNRVIGVPLLLDKFTGAAAAYSLRALSSTTTDVVRVRRSSDNAEQDFSPDEIEDGSLVSWVGAGNDGFVTTWYDQAGSNDATQTTAANQPKIVDSGSLVTENGKAAVDFDGSDDYLTVGVGNSLDYTNNNIFVFSVNMADSGGSSSMRLCSDDKIGIQGYFNIRPYDTGNNGNAYNDGTGYYFDTSIQAAIGSQTQITNYLIGSSGFFANYQNGIEYESGTITGWDGSIGASGQAGFAIASGADGGGYFEGNQQELIIYASDQSANRTAIESNINNYYSIY